MLNRFLNMRISRKLTLGFLIVTLLAVIIGAVGILNNISISLADTALYKENTLGLQYAGDAAVEFQQIRYNALKEVWLNGSDMDSIKAAANEIEASKKKMDELFAKCKETVKKKEILNYIDELNGYWKNYTPMIDQLVSYKLKGNQAEVDKLVSPMAKQGITLRDGFLEMFNKISAEASAKSASNVANANRSNVIMIAVIIIGIILSFVLAKYISRVIAKPLGLATTVAEMLAVGDIEVSATINNDKTYLRKDEIGKLSAAFLKLISSTSEQIEAAKKVASGDLTVEVAVRSEKDQLGKSLSELVSSLNDMAVSILSASNQVASGAQLVSNSSMVLSQGATEQASSIEELTASLEEISSQTSLNAQNAVKANQLSTNAHRDAESGNKQMLEMLGAMDAINQSSGNISKIIKVIDDIAFQTNILALNAAVEAARAGQHGKGFAVVAEEVRTLAAKSANAAKETTDMIENSIKIVDAGIKIANQTAEALGKIVTQVADAAEIVGSIATASNEQAIGIEQLNLGISQVSQVVQSNAATSEESAAASEELASQAEQLNQTVGVFKVRQTKVWNTLNIADASQTTVRKSSSTEAIKPKNSQTYNDLGKY